MNKDTLLQGAAICTAAATGAGVATGALITARGETTGAPGITKGFARIGRLAGGSMLTGVALVGGGAALAGLALYKSITYQ